MAALAISSSSARRASRNSTRFMATFLVLDLGSRRRDRRSAGASSPDGMPGAMRPGWESPGSGLDGFAVAVASDLDLVWLGLLGNWNRQPKDPSVILGPHPVCVQVVAQKQLPAEHSARALGGDHLGVLAIGDGPLGFHGQHVSLNIDVDVLSVY